MNEDLTIDWIKRAWGELTLQDVCWCGMPISEYYNNIRFVMLH